MLQLEKNAVLTAMLPLLICVSLSLKKYAVKTVVKPKESKEHIRSQKIDRILTGKYTCHPMFCRNHGRCFYLTFNVIGACLQDLLALGIDALTKVTDHVLTAANVNPAIHGLVD